jgi:hypothetical protein
MNEHPALLHGSTGVVGIENNSWAARAAAEFREKERNEKRRIERLLWQAELETE